MNTDERIEKAFHQMNEKSARGMCDYYFKEKKENEALRQEVQRLRQQLEQANKHKEQSINSL